MLCFVLCGEQQKDGIMAILAAVLHISDIQFETDTQTDGVFVKNDEVLMLGRCGADITGVTFVISCFKRR